MLVLPIVGWLVGWLVGDIRETKSILAVRALDSTAHPKHVATITMVQDCSDLVLRTLEIQKQGPFTM